jgi:hypothetical protein
MEGHRTVILLPPTGSSDYDRIAKTASKRTNDAEKILLVPLGFHSDEELSSFKATIRYPEEFFDRGKSDQIDSQALELARSWYRPLGNQIVFEGINLAQMSEYSFYFVFVDCLRSLLIAKGLLEAEGIERLVLPKTILTKEISEICYEGLPNAVELMAMEQGVVVERPAPIADNLKERENAKSFLGWDKAHTYEKFLEIAAPLIRKNAVLFQNVYAYDRLAQETKKRGLRPLRLIPYRRSGPNTKGFSESLEARSEGILKTLVGNHADMKDDSRAATIIARERIDEFLSHSAPMLAEYIEWAGYCSKKIKPRVLVSMEDITPVNRCISRVLREGGAQIVILQHGLLTKDMAGSYLMPIEGNIQAVWGRYFVEWHTKRGADPNTLVVTGNPNFDSIRPNEGELISVRERLGLEADRPILLIGTSRYSGISSVFTFEKERRFYDGIYSGLRGLYGYQIVTKMHPSCGKAYYDMAERSAANYDVRAILTKDNLRELLALSQVVIIPSSTIGYEAVLLRKPLVCVDFETKGEESAFVDSNVAVRVEKANELAPGMESAINLTASKEYEASRDLFIDYHLNRSGASSKIADLVNERYHSLNGDKGTI